MKVVRSRQATIPPVAAAGEVGVAGQPTARRAIEQHERRRHTEKPADQNDALHVTESRPKTVSSAVDNEPLPQTASVPRRAAAQDALRNDRTQRLGQTTAPVEDTLQRQRTRAGQRGTCRKHTEAAATAYKRQRSGRIRLEDALRHPNIRCGGTSTRVGEKGSGGRR